MTKKQNAPKYDERSDSERENEKPRLTQTPDGQLHDADGLLVDEYSDPTIRHQPASDALDDPAALVNERVLDNVADGDGIEEIDTVAEGSELDRMDGGGRRVGGPTHRPH